MTRQRMFRLLEGEKEWYAADQKRRGMEALHKLPSCSQIQREE
jgi:hypothetical protein